MDLTKFPPRTSLLASKLAVMIIDMQEKFLHYQLTAHPKEISVLVESQGQLFKWAAKNGVDVRIFEMDGFGDTVPQLWQKVEEASLTPFLFPKNNNSAFAGEFGESVLSALKSNGIETLILGGINTHACVHATIVNSVGAGIKVILPNNTHANVYCEKVQWYKNRLELMEGDGEIASGCSYGEIPPDRLFSDLHNTSCCIGLIDAARSGESQYLAYRQKLLAAQGGMLALPQGEHAFTSAF